MPCPAEAPQWDTNAQACRTCAAISLAAPLWTEGVGCTACQQPTAYYDKYADRCVAECPLTAPVRSAENVCTRCAEVDPAKALWDPAVGACVGKCVTEIRDDAMPVCKTCAEKNASLPLRVGDTCVSYYSYVPARPAWSAEAQQCRACGKTVDSAGKSFFDSARGECVEQCPETYDVRRVCRLCREVDSRTPAALNGECVPCYIANISTPKYVVERQQCEACPQDASQWNSTLRMCITPCVGNTIRIETGQCAEANSTNCRAPWVFVRNESGPFCLECSAEEGLAYADGSCRCDAARHLAAQDDGKCGCQSAQLAYNDAVGECVCRDGMNMTFPDGDFGSPRCETGCPSGVFEYERPYLCVDACPPYQVLYNQSGRLLCGACDGYVYYDAARGMTRCLDYFACANQRMEPQIVREAGSPRRVCAEGALQTNYTVGDEVAEGVQRVAVY